MAMPPGGFTPTDVYSQFPYPPDNPYVFLSWISEKFAEANAMINSLCQHLEAVGDHNEYAAVISSINHRRFHWPHDLPMYQFFPITDISYNLQHVAWRRQQQRMRSPQILYNSDQIVRFGGRRSGSGFNMPNDGGYRGTESMSRNVHCSISEDTKLESDEKTLSVAEEKSDGSEKPMSVSKHLEESESPAAEIENHCCDPASKGTSESRTRNGNSLNSDCHSISIESFEDPEESKLESDEKTDGSEKPVRDSKDLVNSESPAAEVVNHCCEQASKSTSESRTKNTRSLNSDCHSISINSVENQKETKLESDEKTDGSEKPMSDSKHLEESESPAVEIVNHCCDQTSKGTSESRTRNGHSLNSDCLSVSIFSVENLEATKPEIDENTDGSEKPMSDSEHLEESDSPAGEIVNHCCDQTSKGTSESKTRNGHSLNSGCLSVSIVSVENLEETKPESGENTDGSEKPMSNSKHLEESESPAGEIVNYCCDQASKGTSESTTRNGHSLNSGCLSVSIVSAENLEETKPESDDNTDNSLSSEQKRDEEDKECSTSTAQTFVVEEMHNAEMVNVVEGLKLYNNLLDAEDVSQLVSLVNNLRKDGRERKLQSEAYKRFNRPFSGHGREIIQLGLPIAEAPLDYESMKGRRFEPIPSFLSDIIESLVSKEIISVKPDACIVDFFSEGDFSQPHWFFSWFGRPVGVLSLSECDFVFGRNIVQAPERAGEFKGSLKLSLTPGSVIMVEGKSADFARLAINSTPNQRILITFTKCQFRNSLTKANRFPPISISPNQNVSYSTGPPNYFPVIPTTGMLPTPYHQPIFIAPSPPLGLPMPFPFCVPPRQMVWPLPYPQQQAPPQHRMQTSGTGVFIPLSSAQEPVSQGSPEKSNNSNGSNSAEEGKLNLKVKEEACNGIAADKSGSGGGDGDGKQSN